MGRILDAGDIGRATSASGAINSSLCALDSLQSELTDFADNPELQGKGWDSARAVINNVFNVLTDSYLMLGEMILQANAKLGDAASKLKSGYIDEDALKAQLDMIKQNIEMTHAAMAAAAAVDSTTGMGATMIRICEQRLRELEQQKKKIKEVLESLDDFDAATSGLYSSALALQSQINGLVTNVANKGTWSTSTGMFTTSKLNKELIKELKGQVKDYRTQSELLSFLADGGEIAVYKSAAKVNFHMEQTEKVGFKDAEVVIWYLVKGGVAINLNDFPELKDVSEFLRKKGPKLNKKAYREITYSEAQKMTADSTGGLNYFSYYFNQMTLPVKDLIGVALATKAVKMTGKFPGGDNDRVSATKGGGRVQQSLSNPESKAASASGKVSTKAEEGQKVLRDAIDEAPKIEYKTGVSEKYLDSITNTKVDLEEGILRPNPEEYLTKKYIAEHNKQFDNGAIKIQKFSPSDLFNGGKIGNPEDKVAFVIPKDIGKKVIEASGGDPRKLEELLGLHPGDLGDNPAIINIDHPQNVHIPSGNEKSAFPEYWQPGGYTYGKIPEAVIDEVPKGEYTWHLLN
ncbi:T7SS effector LXG polymorphic toxin [Lactovum odontotermitis]